jgi:hypothetical protein
MEVQVSRCAPGALDRASRFRSLRGSLAVLAGALAVLVTSTFAAGEALSADAGPQATTAAADPTVGALFADASAATHDCTASVLSAGHGLLLTAAHCLRGTGAGMRFIPGYDGTATEPAPNGTWTVTKAWAAADWLTAQQPAHDFAVLKVADQPVGGVWHSIEQVTGGHSVSLVGRTVDDVAGPSVGPVTVVAYNAGAGDAAVTCTVGGLVEPVPDSFRCGGYSGGTSGGPWMQRGAVKGRPRLVGVIGGPHQGGCTDAVSYSPTFDGAMAQLLSRAEADVPGDVLPVPGADGC